MNKNQSSIMLNLTRLLFFINAAVWAVFGILSMLRATDSGSSLRWMISILMFANAIVMGWFGMKIVTGKNWIFFLGFLYMAVNVVLSITDQFGWIDALILLLNLVILGLLFVSRLGMKQVQAKTPGEG